MSPVVTTPTAGSGVGVGENPVPDVGCPLAIHLPFSTLWKYSPFNFCTKYIFQQTVFIAEKSYYRKCCSSISH